MFSQPKVLCQKRRTYDITKLHKQIIMQGYVVWKAKDNTNLERKSECKVIPGNTMSGHQTVQTLTRMQGICVDDVISVHLHSLCRRLNTVFRVSSLTEDFRLRTKHVLCMHFMIIVLLIALWQVEHFNTRCVTWVLATKTKPKMRTMHLSTSACSSASRSDVAPGAAGAALERSVAFWTSLFSLVISSFKLVISRDRSVNVTSRSLYRSRY